MRHHTKKVRLTRENHVEGGLEPDHRVEKLRPSPPRQQPKLHLMTELRTPDGKDCFEQGIAGLWLRECACASGHCISFIE